MCSTIPSVKSWWKTWSIISFIISESINLKENVTLRINRGRLQRSETLKFHGSHVTRPGDESINNLSFELISRVRQTLVRYAVKSLDPRLSALVALFLPGAFFNDGALSNVGVWEKARESFHARASIYIHVQFVVHISAKYIVHVSSSVSASLCIWDRLPRPWLGYLNKKRRMGDLWPTTRGPERNSPCNYAGCTTGPTTGTAWRSVSASSDNPRCSIMNHCPAILSARA